MEAVIHGKNGKTVVVPRGLRPVCCRPSKPPPVENCFGQHLSEGNLDYTPMKEPRKTGSPTRAYTTPTPSLENSSLCLAQEGGFSLLDYSTKSEIPNAFIVKEPLG